MYEYHGQGKCKAAIVPTTFHINISMTNENDVILHFCDNEGENLIDCKVQIWGKDNANLFKAHFDEMGEMLLFYTLDYLDKRIEECVEDPDDSIRTIEMDDFGDYLSCYLNQGLASTIKQS